MDGISCGTFSDLVAADKQFDSAAVITALILALIITPMQSFNDLWFLGWAAVLANASKYIIALKRMHRDYATSPKA